MSKSQVHQGSVSTAWIHIQTTVASQDDARRLAKCLVEARLAACVQIQPGVESVYWWQGKIEQELEWVLVIKTHASLWESLLDWFDEHHPYDCPQMIALPLTRVAPSFEAWLKEQILDSPDEDPTSVKGGSNNG